MRAVAALALLLSATSALAADDAAWTVAPPDKGASSMSRTIEDVTLVYQRKPDDDDTLRLTVKGCGDTPWYIQESLNGVTLESLRADVAEEFTNARLNCKLADGVEQRMLARLEDAFSKVKPMGPPRVQTFGGWKLEDRGSMPGDDSERSITLSKALQTVSMVYSPSESGEGASTQIEFKPCKGSRNSSGFDFGNPPEDHLKVINEQVAEAYSDFAKDCKTAPEPQAALMQDFPQALATLERWLKEKPFVYPSGQEH